ncbi:glycoside-pentoside-hexuronide (GPH):cation symporter [Paenibacillus polysaccharolyticus]|uniref:MFS transporter n=1 Tax=Paenibacillus polysaccharolyticus TaxID=582692 RepID=UPI00209D1017|nr:glycoside-pentoside-hexuronide (GPH):cation symporter [Paenibacillus polysaccharolyticus]MCP1133650.1 glycoside-pentoside-hexuronide (GPH):cation symporter [Paenibacillus polysaccharolyticus]
MERELTKKELFGDTAGSVSLSIMTALLGLMTFYYTDVVGVSAGVVGTALLFAKLLDAGADIGMGVLIDRTRSKHGQARPWLLRMIIPIFVSIFLLFSVPDLSPGAKLTYAVLTNILFYIFVLTPTSIPYISLMALTTRSQQDRALMGILRASANYFTGAIIVMAFIPAVTALGGGKKEWTLLASILGIIASLGIFFAFRYSNERYNTQQLKDVGEIKKNYTLKEGLGLLFTNKYWLIVFFIALISNINFAVSASAGMYYAKYIWGNVNLVGLMGALSFIPMVLAFLVSGPIIKRWGQRNTAIFGLIVGILGSLIRLIDLSSIPLGLAGSVLQGFGVIPLMIVLSPLMTSTIEYGEWKHGQRIVGLTNSVNAFGGKIGTALGTALIGWLLAFGHYESSSLVQTDAAKSMIIVMNIYLPLFTYTCMTILLLFYSLEKQYVGILDDLKKRREGNIQ